MILKWLKIPGGTKYPATMAVDQGVSYGLVLPIMQIGWRSISYDGSPGKTRTRLLNLTVFP